MKRFAIPIKGLSIGKHHYSFEADDDLFAHFEGSEIRGGTAVADVEVTKTANNLLAFDMHIEGYVTVACDRCLEDLKYPVSYDGGFKVRFGDATDDFDGDVMWIDPAENEVNIGQYIYESLVLELPYQRVHEEGECNPEMTSRFKVVSQEEFDRMAAGAEMQKMEDNPEWQKLRELKDKL